MEDLTKHYLISGRVQGVGFRAFTHRRAREMGLRGWVRNLTDGRVEAVACGPATTLSDFEQRLRQGPAGGQVDDMQVWVREKDWAPLRAQQDFEVRKDGLQPCTDRD